MTKNYRQEIIDLAQAQSLTTHHAASLVWNAADPDELKAHWVRQQAESASRELRLRAFKDGIEATTYEQQALNGMGVNVPKVVRVDMDGEEVYKPSQDATTVEHADHFQWLFNKQATILGRVERAAQGWRRLVDNPEVRNDVPFGELQYAGIDCAICHTAWRKNDPFEWAHDTALGNGSQNQRMQLAHRSCNRAEGQGFVNIA